MDVAAPQVGIALFWDEPSYNEHWEFNCPCCPSAWLGALRNLERGNRAAKSGITAVTF